MFLILMKKKQTFVWKKILTKLWNKIVKYLKVECYELGLGKKTQKWLKCSSDRCGQFCGQLFKCGRFRVNTHPPPTCSLMSPRNNKGMAASFQGKRYFSKKESGQTRAKKKASFRERLSSRRSLLLQRWTSLVALKYLAGRVGKVALPFSRSD